MVSWQPAHHPLNPLPAERAGAVPPAPAPDAPVAEAVGARVHIGGVRDVVHADGAQAVCRCLSRLRLLQLAAAAPRSRAALLHTRRHALPRETCRMAECALR